MNTFLKSSIASVALAAGLSPVTVSAEVFSNVFYDVNLLLIAGDLDFDESANVSTSTQATFVENFQAVEQQTATSTFINFDSAFTGTTLSVNADAGISANQQTDPLASIRYQGLAQYEFTLDTPTEILIQGELRSLDPGASDLTTPGFAWSRLALRQLGTNANTIYLSPDRTDGSPVFVDEQLILETGDYLYQVDVFGSLIIGGDGPTGFSQSTLTFVPEPGTGAVCLIGFMMLMRRRRS